MSFAEGIVSAVALGAEIDVATIDAAPNDAAVHLVFVEVEGGVAAFAVLHVNVFGDVVEHGADMGFFVVR